MNDRFVINIGRQLGSGGRQIGQSLARQLSVAFYDKELIMMASRESGLRPELFEQADEHKRLGLWGTFSGLFSGVLGENYVGKPAIGGEALFEIQSGVIRRLADEHSCIFVGRCADYVLREHPRAVNVFVCADEHDRIRRIMELQGCPERKAREAMQQADRKRSAYYNFFSGRTWGAASTYHLCVNSSALGIEATTGLILSFARSKLSL